MKTKLTVALLFILGWPGMMIGQDLIVTHKGDSINSKITKIKSDFIYFTFKQENEIKNTLLARKQVKEYKKDFYPVSDTIIEIIAIPRFRIGVSGGWSYRLAKINAPDFLMGYARELKSGYHIGSDANFFLSKAFGLGIKYSKYYSWNEFDGMVYINDTVRGIKGTGPLREYIRIQHFAPSFCFRSISKNEKIHFISNFSIGLLNYKNNATVVTSYILTGKALGTSLEYILDYFINKNFALGISCSYTSGFLSQYSYDDGKRGKIIKLDVGSFEGLSRLDIAVGLKWNR